MTPTPSGMSLMKSSVEPGRKVGFTIPTMPRHP
jgi:hypothetical protein